MAIESCSQFMSQSSKGVHVTGPILVDAFPSFIIYFFIHDICKATSFTDDWRLKVTNCNMTAFGSEQDCIHVHKCACQFSFHMYIGRNIYENVNIYKIFNTCLPKYFLKQETAIWTQLYRANKIGFSYPHRLFISKPETYSYPHRLFTSKPETYSYSHRLFTSKPETYSCPHRLFTSKPETYTICLDLIQI